MVRTSELLCVETRALLGSLLEGELGPAERARIERHVASCPACAHELAIAERAAAALRDLPEAEKVRLRDAALRELGLDEPTRSRRLRRVLAALVGCVVVVIIIIIWLHGRVR
jgi:anti-sigma factor RsiW